MFPKNVILLPTQWQKFGNHKSFLQTCKIIQILKEQFGQMRYPTTVENSKYIPKFSKILNKIVRLAWLGRRKILEYTRKRRYIIVTRTRINDDIWVYHFWFRINDFSGYLRLPNSSQHQDKRGKRAFKNKFVLFDVEKEWSRLFGQFYLMHFPAQWAKWSRASTFLSTDLFLDNSIKHCKLILNNAKNRILN